MSQNNKPITLFHIGDKSAPEETLEEELTIAVVKSDSIACIWL